MKHIKLRDVQQYDGEFTDLFIIGSADNRTVAAVGTTQFPVWSAGTDFTTAGTTQTYTLTPLAIGDFVHGGALMYVETTVTGGSVSAATLELGVTGALTSIIAASDVFTNAVAAGGAFGSVSATPYMTQAASKNLLATLITTTANVSTLTAGRVWIWAKISRAKDFTPSPTGDRYE